MKELLRAIGVDKSKINSTHDLKGLLQLVTVYQRDKQEVNDLLSVLKGIKVQKMENSDRGKEYTRLQNLLKEIKIVQNDPQKSTPLTQLLKSTQISLINKKINESKKVNTPHMEVILNEAKKVVERLESS